MISLDRLVCRAYWEQAMLTVHSYGPARRPDTKPKVSFANRGFSITPTQFNLYAVEFLHVTNTDDDTWLMPATPATKVQHEDHRNALDGKALQKTPVWL
jgi:hypothetical protein